MPDAGPRRGTAWGWALLPLLLAAGLTIPVMTRDAFYFDEVNSILAAGGPHAGPWSLTELVQDVARRSPEQALGWPLLLSLWGRAVGWSELAVRALSLFSGMLALAMIYRTGHDCFAPRAGLFAALLLAASSFFLIYLTNARAFPLVAMFTALCLWAYQRLMPRPRQTGWYARAALLAGAGGLLWTHYFAALLLPALALCHLLPVPRTRCRWRPLLPLLPAGLIATLQLPVFLAGLNRALGDTGLHNRALDAPRLLSHFLHRLTNGAIQPAPPLDTALLLLLILVLPALALRRFRRDEARGALTSLALLSAMTLLLMLAANEAFKVVDDSRIRYLMPLWPLLALLAGAGLWQLSRRRGRVAVALAALWLVTGAWHALATPYRYEVDVFRRTDFHRVYPIMRRHVSPEDLLLLDTFAARLDSGRYYSGVLLGAHWYIARRYNADPWEEVRSIHEDYPSLWLLYLSKDRVGFTDLPAELGRVFCERVLDEWGFTLERYALHSVDNCPARATRLKFDQGIRLVEPLLTIRKGVLRLDAHVHSDDNALLANYSLAVHVTDTPGGKRVAQGDVGLGPGHIVPLRSEFDLPALPSGDYELRVALYDWQTGARLAARDLQTGEIADMHVLERFHIGP